jgi:hypothetical protein
MFARDDLELMLQGRATLRPGPRMAWSTADSTQIMCRSTNEATLDFMS